MQQSNRKTPLRMIFLGFIIAVFAITNTWTLLRFLNWISEFEHMRNVVFDFSSYLAVQAHQNSLLQNYLVVFSLGLAILAFLGYNAIKQGAENRAEVVAKRAADEVLINAESRAEAVAKHAADEVLKKYIESFETKERIFAEIVDKYGMKTMPKKDEVTEMKVNSQEMVVKR